MFEHNAHNMGQMFLDFMKKRPDAVCQIDAATGQQETNASVLRRSIRLARCFRTLSLGPGDVLAIGGNNHIDLHIPYYAALMNGMVITGVDPLFKLAEIRTFFKLTQPKIAFCEADQRSLYMEAASTLDLDTKVVSFTGDESMHQLIEEVVEEPIEEFQATALDEDNSYLWMVSTGGTTGVLKVAAIKHSAVKAKIKSFVKDIFKSTPTDGSDQPNTIALNLSPIQWISGLINMISMPLVRQTKLMTSAPATVDHVIDIINKYRPISCLMGPSLATGIVKSPKPCDLTCFHSIFFTGGKIYSDMIEEVKVAYFKSLGGQGVNNKVSRVMKYALSDSIASKFNFYGKRSDKKPFAELRLRASIVVYVLYENGRKFAIQECGRGTVQFIACRNFASYKKRVNEHTMLIQAYGQTENLGPVLAPNPFGPLGNCGRAILSLQIKLVDPESGKEITQPNAPGELWTKGICFSEYYNNPEETAKAFSEDGWFKTGDLLYRDEQGNYYFVERLNMLIKYRNYHVVPPELEEVIRSHPGVLEVSVTSIPHSEDGEHAVACVVRRAGCDVTAQEVKDLVAENLSETKQLRGGVIFMDQLPMTSVGKVARGKLREIARNTSRE